MDGRLKRFFDLSQSATPQGIKSLPNLSHASCAHAYGRAISSSGLSEVATLRERASSERADSINSGGRGPFRAGTSPVRACSTLALLIVVVKWTLDVVTAQSARRWVRVAISNFRASTWTLGCIDLTRNDSFHSTRILSLHTSSGL